MASTLVQNSLALAEIRRQEPQLKALLTRANEFHNRVFEAGRTMVKSAAESGRWISKIKQLLPHGHFEEWIENNADFSPRTARTYMKLGDHIDELIEAKGTEIYGYSIESCLKLLPSKMAAHPKEAISEVPSDLPLTGKMAQVREPVDGTDECPHGGKHEYDAEACVRCHDPKPSRDKPSRAAAGADRPVAAGEDAADEAAGRGGESDHGVGPEKQITALFQKQERLYAELTQGFDQLKHLLGDRYSHEADEGLDVSYQDFRKMKKRVLA